MGDKTSSYVRGAQPPQLSLNKAEQAQLAELEQRLQVESVHLHPLLLCVPIPDVSPKERNKLQKEVNRGWKIPVAMVVDEKNHFILTDSLQLSLWLASGRSVLDLPKQCVAEVPEADALAWYLTHHVPKTWAKFHRAAAAVLFAAQAHKQFRSLSLPDGTKPDTVNAFLSTQVAVSPRLVAGALKLLRLWPARFRLALAGQRRVLTKTFVDRGVAPGSRAKKIHITKMDYFIPELKFNKRATLAIADLDLVPFNNHFCDLIVELFKLHGLIVLIGHEAKDASAQLVKLCKNLSLQFQASKEISCLTSLKLNGGEKPMLELRGLVILYLASVNIQRPAGEKWDFSKWIARNSKLIKNLIGSKILSTCSYPLNARKARILLYERLIKKLAGAKAAPVLALGDAYYNEEQISRGNKTKVFLSCLKSAAGRSDHRNLILCYSRIIEAPDTKTSLPPRR